MGAIKRVDVDAGGFCLQALLQEECIHHPGSFGQSVFPQAKRINRLDKLFIKGCQFLGCGC